MLYAITAYSISCGKVYACCEAKPPVIKLLKRLGIQLYIAPDQEIVQSNIRKDDLAYYLTPPAPKFCIAQLQQTRDALTGKIPPDILKNMLLNDMSEQAIIKTPSIS